MTNFTTLGQPLLGEKFVWWSVVVGGWLRVNLVLCFGPNHWVSLWALAFDQAEQMSSFVSGKPFCLEMSL